MPVDDVEERRSNAFDVHRDLGRLEGRVGSLEGGLMELKTDIKKSLDFIFSKLNDIQNDLSKRTGEADGEKISSDKSSRNQQNKINFIFAVITILIAGISAYYAAHH